MPRHLARAAVAVALISSAMTPVALAESWKDFEFNYQPIRCRDSHSPDGTVRIV
jgi:hypothetical protein